MSAVDDPPPRPMARRAAALITLGVALAVAVLVVSGAGGEGSPTELLYNTAAGLGINMAPGSGSELKKYSHVLSFEGHGDDGHDPDAGHHEPELTESAGDSAHWARNYLKDGQLFMGEKPNSVALQGVDCFYSHPVAECEAARSQRKAGMGEQLSAAQPAPLPVYDMDCYYKHTVEYCMSLKQVLLKKEEEARLAQAVPPHYTAPQLTSYAPRGAPAPQAQVEQPQAQQVQEARRAAPQAAAPPQEEPRVAPQEEGAQDGGDAALDRAMALPRMQPLAEDETAPEAARVGEEGRAREARWGAQAQARRDVREEEAAAPQQQPQREAQRGEARAARAAVVEKVVKKEGGMSATQRWYAEHGVRNIDAEMEERAAQATARLMAKSARIQLATAPARQSSLALEHVAVSSSDSSASSEVRDVGDRAAGVRRGVGRAAGAVGDASVAAQEGGGAAETFARLRSAALRDGLSLVPLADFRAGGGEGGAVARVRSDKRDETDAWGSEHGLRTIRVASTSAQPASSALPARRRAAQGGAPSAPSALAAG
ncbi:hypothetical protein T484DRAFT_1918912, partial [Baffinella frigidus]